VIKVFVIGRIGSDPADAKDYKGADCVAFSLAGQNFSKTEETTWFDCLVYGKTGDVIKNYTKKGSRIFVEGSIKTIAGAKGKKQFLSANSINLLDPKPAENVAAKKEEDDDQAPF
jgi:single-strand DNA-binding protein